MTSMLDRDPGVRRLVLAESARPDDWAKAIADDPHPLPEQSPEWIGAICATGGFRDASRAYRFDDGTTVVLPLVRSSVLTGRGLWSPPAAWGVGGIVGPADEGTVAAVVDDLRTLGSVRLSVRIDAAHEPWWQAVVTASDIAIPRRSHVVELLGSPDEHFASLSKSTRRNVRLAERAGVRVEIDRTGALLPTHHDLFMQSVDRWAEQQHEPLWLARLRAKHRDPLDKLEAMQHALGERMLTVMSYVGDRPASSAIVLLGATTRFTRGAMDVELAGPSRANYAVQWAAITEAYRHGATRYHLGESGTSDGLATFKEKWGAVPLEHHEYRFERVPVTATVDAAKRTVKKLIGFEDG